MQTWIPFLALLFLGLFHRGLAGSCACATSNVNIRSGPATRNSKVGQLTTSKCVQYLGVKQVGGAYTWAKVVYNGNVAWIAENWLNFPSTCPNEDLCFTSLEMAALQDKLMEYEGIRYKAYDAQPSNSNVDWTICVGFNLKRKDASSVLATVLPGVSFTNVYAGRTSLSRAQCLALFKHDLTTIYISRAQNVVGSQYCGLPSNVKIAVVNAVYRGDLKSSHKTAKYMRAGNWCAVPAEYLDYGQYIRCRELGIPGVCTRMDWNAAQFQTMCKRG